MPASGWTDPPHHQPSRGPSGAFPVRATAPLRHPSPPLSVLVGIGPVPVESRHLYSCSCGRRILTFPPKYSTKNCQTRTLWRLHSCNLAPIYSTGCEARPTPVNYPFIKSLVGAAHLLGAGSATHTQSALGLSRKVSCSTQADPPGPHTLSLASTLTCVIIFINRDVANRAHNLLSRTRWPNSQNWLLDRVNLFHKSPNFGGRQLRSRT